MSSIFNNIHGDNNKTENVINRNIEEKETNHMQCNQQKHIFISHSSKDKIIVKKIVKAIEAMGVNSSNIFCSSIPGYGIELGENFIDRIKNEINSNTIVFFILSENYYKSPIALCEMGAAWINSLIQIPFVVPPLDYEDINGVISNLQAIKVDDKIKWTSVYKKLSKYFNLNIEKWNDEFDDIYNELVDVI